MLKIAVLDLRCPDLTTREGVTWYVQELTRDLPWVLRNPDVVVESWGLGRSAEAEADHLNLRTRGVPAPRGFPTWVQLLLAWSVHASLLLRSRRGTVLLAPTPYMGFGASLARLAKRRPLVVRVMGNAASNLAHVRGRWRSAALLLSLERWVLRRADLVVPMGEFTRHLADRARVIAERIVELPFPTSWRATAELACPAGRRPVVVCAARLVRGKGIDVLLRAFTRVLEENPEASLEIAGDGPERQALAWLARSLGIASRVQFLGWIPATDMPAVYARARVAVLPSRWEEGLGMCLVEAGLAGCALVGSDLGGIRDIVRPGETGILVSPEDSHALAEAIVELLRNPDRATSLGRAAREAALAYLAKRETALEEVRRRMYELAAGR
jgi:glycosyltransferase involved in cell wall biosynthesis